MKKILFGTTNAGKMNRLRAVLCSLPVELYGLQDLNIEFDVEEDGTTPGENAVKKAMRYYKESGIPTFSIDSGLYIDKFPQEKQPGLFVRRINGQKAADQEMLHYYTSELNKAGGKSKGRWVSSIAFVADEERVYSNDYIEETFFTSVKSPVEIEGQPLNSIQIDPKLGKYKSEITPAERSMLQNDIDSKLYDFIKECIRHI